MNVGRDWKRLVLQALAVTASILLAFAIDAWWDQWQDRTEEREAMVRLQREFETNHSRFVEARASHQRILESAVALLAHIDTLGADPLHETPDSLLPSLWNWYTYDPLQGTLSSLVSSGRLSLIEDDSLRIALASWPDLVADLNEDEYAQRAVVRDHLIPFLMRSTSARQLLSLRAQELGFHPTELDESTKRQILSNRELENWLVDRVEGKIALLGPEGEMVEVEQRLEEILELLDREVDSR